MKEFILEACVDSVDSAIIATEAGANRLELCANLMIGGTTPTLATFEEVRNSCNNKVHVLIRPRFGDFLYSVKEFEVIKKEVKSFRDAGADGVVIGCLKADGSLDLDRLSELRELANGMKLTLHRAFDLCSDPFSALEEAIRLGFDNILTSGQKNSVLEGIDILKELHKKSDGRIAILAGSGVDSSILKQVYEETGITNFHMSGKEIIESGMKYRKEDISMGLDNFNEYEILRTSEEKIKRAVEILEQM